MLRHALFFAAATLATPVLAQSATPPRGVDCLVRMNATPTSWIINGYDPFGGSTPEATFNVTYTNEGSAECRFVPLFQLDQGAFGLSKGNGKRIGYALLNLTDSQDVTPRAGRSIRTPSQRELSLGSNESRTLLYKLVADSNDVRDAGTFTQDITIEAQDGRFRSFGGTRLVLGLNVLPSARLGLSGAYTMNDGHAVVDLGELRQGLAPVPLALRVNSTGNYDVTVSSANSGRLILGAGGWYVPYSVILGGNAVNLSSGATVAGPSGNGFRQDSLAIQFVIGDVADRRAGVYSDILSVAVTAR